MTKTAIATATANKPTDLRATFGFHAVPFTREITTDDHLRLPFLDPNQALAGGPTGREGGRTGTSAAGEQIPDPAAAAPRSGRAALTQIFVGSCKIKVASMFYDQAASAAC